MTREQRAGLARLMLRWPEDRAALRLAGASDHILLDLCEGYDLACDAAVYWSSSHVVPVQQYGRRAETQSGLKWARSMMHPAVFQDERGQRKLPIIDMCRPFWPAPRGTLSSRRNRFLCQEQITRECRKHSARDATQYHLGNCGPSLDAKSQEVRSPRSCEPHQSRCGVTANDPDFALRREARVG